MFIMGIMERKQPRRRRSFTPEFKAEIVERCRAGDRTIGQVARDFDLTETAVRAWVAQAETDAGERPGSSLHRGGKAAGHGVQRACRLLKVSRAASLPAPLRRPVAAGRR
jgi:transposase-like protein